MKHKRSAFKRLMSVVLCLSMVMGMVPLNAYAAEPDIYLPEAEMTEDILNNNVFYIPTTAASINENEDVPHLLRIARGGDCEDEASVVVKISDITAKFGVDYDVRVHEEKAEIENPADNQSLLERMEGEEYTQSERKSPEDTLEEIENDPEAKKAAEEGYQSAIDFILEESGYNEKHPDGAAPSEEEVLSDDEASPEDEEQTPPEDGEQTPPEDEEQTPPEDGEQTPPEDGEQTPPEDEEQTPPEDLPEAEEIPEFTPIYETVEQEGDPLQRAKQAYTGIYAEPQRVTSSGDMLQDVQRMADVLTEVVVGASVELTFRPGEQEKYLEITPRDNRDGDGDRYFYVVLSSPGGSCTVSSASTAAITIVDDEGQDPSEVFFSSDVYYSENDVVTVEVRRSGAINSNAEVRMTTAAGTAVAGQDFAPVDRTLLFPFGIDHQTVEIPVQTQHFSGERTFEVLLEDVNSSNVTQERAEVRLLGTADVQQVSASAVFNSMPEDAAPEAAAFAAGRAASSANLATRQYYSPVSIASPLGTGNDDNKYGGNNKLDGDRWLLEWMDNSFWYDRKGTVGATWRLDPDFNYGYHIAGAKVKWSRSGSHATMKAGFTSSIGTYWNNVGSYVYDSDAGFGDGTVIELYSRYQDTSTIGIYNRGNCDDCNRLWISEITPIKRPFSVNLTEADRLTFLQADGSYKADDGTATKAWLDGAANNNNASLVTFEGSTITIKQPEGSNVTQYAALSSLYLVDTEKDADNMKLVKQIGDNANRKISFSFDKQFIADNSHVTRVLDHYLEPIHIPIYKTIPNYIKYRDNNSLTNSAGDGSKSLYGDVTLKPEFSYIDSKVTIKAPDDSYGYIRISGTDYKLAPGESRTLTYHLGDNLSISTVIDDAYKGSYTSPGYNIQYKRTGAERNYSDESIYYVNGQPASIDGGRLSCKEIVITPIYQENDNRITVRIKDRELSLFDTSYGVFQTAQTEKQTINGEAYTDYIYAGTGATVAGKLYPIPARTKSEDGVCIWKEPNNSKQYTGDTFYFTAGKAPGENIIYLSPRNSGSYYALSGTLHYMSYNLKTQKSGQESAMPASGALVSVGSAFGTADSSGKVTTTAFRGLYGYYIRYLTSVNGSATLGEVYLEKAVRDTASQKIDYISRSGETRQVDAYVGGISKTYQSDVSPLTSDIFDTIMFVSSNELGGQVIPITDSFAALQAAIFATEYDLTVSDSNGQQVEHKGLLEQPTKAEFVVYNEKNEIVGSYPTSLTTTGSGRNTRYTFDAAINFGGGENEDGEYVEAPDVKPGDRIFLRLTTNRGTAPGGREVSYTYSDIFTGYMFSQNTEYPQPVMQSVDMPIDISFNNLPLLGDTGMDFNFPFVSVGWMRIDRGYRMYIGASVGSITDILTKSHMTSYQGDGGVYWKDMFSISHPIKSFTRGLSETYNAAFGGAAKLYEGAASSIGVPTWKFDVQLGAYFDFWYATATNPNNSKVTHQASFAGLGFYVGAQLGYKQAWYTILPVVWIPAYIGIELNVNVLGFLGSEKDPSKAEITYDDAKAATVDFKGSVYDKFNGSIKGGASVQIYMGVGLAGTIGVRAQGTVNAMGVYEPSDIVDDGGALSFSAGLIIDLFLFSVPLSYEFMNLKFGSLKQYVDGNGKMRVRSGDMQLLSDNTDFRLREGNQGDPVWRPNDGIALMSGFEETKSEVLVANGYERPDSQLLTLSDGTIVLAYLENDPSKGPYERTTLKFAVYEDGTWSNPVTVQEDGTADFQPSICEADNGRVMISWLSSPSADKTGDPAEYLRSLEVYTAMIDPAGKAVSGLTRLTSDGYYDSMPSCAYDSESGDRIVYYIKSGKATADVSSLANPYTNDCAVVYMLYSEEDHKWLFDKYFDAELDSSLHAEMIREWKGQRFLRSPLPELGLDVPNITDFTVITYNGLAVYAYTIDKDSSNDTDYDKEIFVQLYDFREHKTYRPVRITNDDVSDAMPQLIRTANVDTGADGGADTAHTKLFWFRDGKSINYIDLSKLIREGINDDGTIKDTDEYEFDFGEVSVKRESENESLSMADFKVVEDRNANLYVIWTQPAADEEGDINCQEVYATALIGATDHLAPDADLSDEELAQRGGVNWANPYRLTNSGLYNDEAAVAVTQDGNMLIVHNQFSETLTGDPDHPLEISDLALMSTYLEPCGAVDVVEVQYSNDTPLAGEEITARIMVENNGLTAAPGYTLKVYEGGPGGALLETINGSTLIPGNQTAHEITWTVPSQVSGAKLYITAQETGMNNVSAYTSEALEEKPVYEIGSVESYQSGDGVHLMYSVTNRGNRGSNTSDQVEVFVTGPFGLATRYSVEQCRFYRGTVGEIGIGETREYDVVLDIVPEMFERYGYVSAYVGCYDSSDTLLSNAADADISITQPYDMKINSGRSITLKTGETTALTVDMELSNLFEGGTFTYSVENGDIASIDGNTLKAEAKGSTTIYAVHSPSGAVAEVTLTVTEGTGGDTPAVPDPDSPQGGGTPATPTTPATPAASVSTAPSAEGDAITTATPSAAVTGTAAVSTVTAAMADEIIKQAVANGSGHVVISPAIGKAVTRAEVSIPAACVGEIGSKTEADLTISTAVATVTIPNGGLPGLSELSSGGSVTIVTERTGNTLELSVTAGDRTAEHISGGVTLIAPVENASPGTVATLVREDGTREVIRKSVADETSITIPLSGSASVVIVDNAKTFADISSGHWAADAVAFVSAHELFNGTAPEIFSPNAPMTRGMLAMVLHNLENNPACGYKGVFPDVEDGAWYAEAIAWAAEQGIVGGYGNGQFGPNDSITREQLAVMLYRYAGSPTVPDLPLNFTDASEVSEYALGAMRWAVGEGIINGIGNGLLSPKGKATRAQVAAMLMRYCKAGFSGRGSSLTPVVPGGIRGTKMR